MTATPNLRGSATPLPLDPDALADQGVKTVVLAAPDMQGRLFGRRMSPAQFRDRLDGIDACTCALAWDVESLIAFRVLQGVGGGMLTPVGMTMLFRAFPPTGTTAK